MQIGLWWCWVGVGGPQPEPIVVRGGGFVGGRAPGHFGAKLGLQTPTTRIQRRKRREEPDLPAPEYRRPPQLVPESDIERSRQLLELVASIGTPRGREIRLPEGFIEDMLAEGARQRVYNRHDALLALANAFNVSPRTFAGMTPEERVRAAEERMLFGREERNRRKIAQRNLDIAIALLLLN